jgi:7,8-dihydroneopterin aldolase/epimerase/oxygenase
MSGKPDQILVSQLTIASFIGATDEEQERPQRLRVSLVLEPVAGFAGLNDELARTVDYYTASRAVKALAAQGKRRLIETLAEDIAQLLLMDYSLAAVEVEVRKFILPDTEYVAVRIRRERTAT